MQNEDEFNDIVAAWPGANPQTKAKLVKRVSKLQGDYTEALRKVQGSFKWDIALLLPVDLADEALQDMEGSAGRYAAKVLAKSSTIPFDVNQKTLAFFKPWLKSKPTDERRQLVAELLEKTTDDYLRVELLSIDQQAGSDIEAQWIAIAPPLLVGDDIELRSQVLWLVTGAQKSTVRVSPIIFTILKQTAHVWLAEATSRSRNAVHGVIRQLLLRMRASTWRKPDFGAEQEFAQWLLDYVTDHWLEPNAPYRCLSTATQVMKLYVASGIDKSVPSKYYERAVTTPWSFNVDIYTPKRVVGIVNLVAHDYSDIRSFAADLLQTAPVSTAITTLKNRAEVLLAGARGRQGDGGARMAATAYMLMDRKDADEYLNQIIEKASTTEAHGYFAALTAMVQIGAPDAHKLLELVFRVWSNSEQVLTNGAPEGHKPIDGDAQEILSHAWRAVKESVALVEVLVAKLSVADLKALGNELVQQLTSIRHRGAFSSVQPAFSAVCKRCRSEDELKHLPKQWLEAELKDVRENERLVTRRSAGLPMLVTSVLASQPELIVETTTNLLVEAEKPATTEDLKLPQVHAYNCVRAIILDARISHESEQCIEPALKAAIRACGSPTWVLRNCGVMLFASIHARLFRKGKISASVFFGRYKTLEPVLYEYLGKSTVETVFPVLSLLQMLEVPATYDGLVHFEPLIVSLLAHKEWKIRENAARTLAAIAQTPITPEFSLQDQNKLHGHALALQAFGAHIKFDLELIAQNPCLETKVALAKIYDGRLPPSPVPERLSPSWAEYEAVRLEHDPELVPPSEYRDEWAPIWRVAIDRAPLDQVRHIMATTKLPDMQNLCLEYLPKNEVAQYTGTQYAQSVREKALGLASWTSTEQLEQLVAEFSDEDGPTPSRVAALEAMKNHVLSPELTFHLLKFLSDDEDEIRDEAARLAAKLVGGHRQSPRDLEVRVAALLSPEIAQAKLEAMLDFNAVQKAIESEQLLFAVEKPNLYRDDNAFIALLAAKTTKTQKAQNLREEIRKALKNDGLVNNWYLWTQLAVCDALC